jgi:AraC-like DNA-binding protein
MPIRYQEYRPTPALRPFVECYWSLDGQGDGSPAVEPVFPDGRMEVLFHRGDRFTRILDRGGEEVQARRLLAGQLTRPLQLRPGGRISVVAARFRPGGAFRFVPVPQHELTDQVLDLDLFWRAPAALDEPDEVDTRVRILERLLLARLGADGETGPVDAAIGSILRSRGTMPIETVAERAGLTRRQLERTFLHRVGVPPKVLSRIIRFQHALAAIGSGEAGATLAATCGFYDQAHFIRDFKAFSGSTPGAYWGQAPGEQGRHDLDPLNTRGLEPIPRA